MINIYLCDDNIEDFEEISDFIYSLDLVTRVRIFPHDKTSIKQVEEKMSEIDILITEIETKNIDGIKLAKRFRDKEFSGEILYLTREKGRVFDVFETRPLDFVLKDDLEKLGLVLKNTIVDIFSKQNDFIILGNISKRTKILKKNIEYIESFKRKMIIREKDAKISECYMKVDDMVELLSSESFVRIHKSFIVNLGYVKSVDKNTVYMKNGMGIPMGRAHKDDINRLISYALDSKIYEE